MVLISKPKRQEKEGGKHRGELEEETHSRTKKSQKKILDQPQGHLDYSSQKRNGFLQHLRGKRR